MTPATVTALTNEALRAQADHVIKPYSTSAKAITVRYWPANVSEVQRIRNWLFLQQQKSHSLQTERNITVFNYINIQTTWIS